MTEVQREHAESLFKTTGFRMPAEWEPHRATWLAWPHNRHDWPHRFNPIPWVWAEFVKKLIQYNERVCILAKDKEQVLRIEHYLKREGVDHSMIEIHVCLTDRSWVRDTGPLFVYGSDDDERYAILWKFNGWAKYPNYQRDAKVGGKLAKITKTTFKYAICKQHHVVLEGGAIDVNGSGFLLATEECLLSSQQARNPHLDRTEIEAVFREYLGITRVIWLAGGILGDDTHGHIDDVARFVDSDKIVAAVEDEKKDFNHAPLLENLRRLRSTGLNIIPLPMPSPVIFDGTQLPASYCNFYIANHAVFVPTFNDPQDRVAMEIIGDLFPDREIVGIHSTELVWGFGALHCATMQEPIEKK